MNLDQYLQGRWYGNPGWLHLLFPLEFIYRFVIALRRRLYRSGLLSSWRPPVPVIVIGNITVGGTGKTPAAIALCELLQRAGFSPGVISRGYRSNPPHVPYAVNVSDSAEISGDEPLLMARRMRCPVVIAPRRADAARCLLAQHRCDVIICDDGLQHYALQRDVELAVIDAARKFGNGYCLPRGPLREPATRLREVDAILLNGAAITAPPEYSFQLTPSALVQLNSNQAIPPRTWCKQNPHVHAVAGIGNPERFFESLRALGCNVIEHAFPDHHAFNASDLMFDDDVPIVMTEKDAMKCGAFAQDRHWYLQVRAQLPDSLAQVILTKLNAVRRAKNSIT